MHIEKQRSARVEMDFTKIIQDVRNKGGGETSSQLRRLCKVAVVSGLFQSYSYEEVSWVFWFLCVFFVCA